MAQNRPAWNSKLYGLFNGQLSRTFRTELEAAGYPVPIRSDAIFNTPADRDRQRSSGLLYVGALIKKPSFFIRAFAAAGRNLPADDRFQAAVLAVPVALAARDSANGTELLKLAGAKPSAETLNKRVTAKPT